MRHLKRKRLSRHDIWHLDEVVVSIAGQKHWLSRAIDQEGYAVNEIALTRSTSNAAALGDGAAALNGLGRTYELGTTTLGLRAEARLSQEVPLTLKGLLGWRHAVGDVEPAALLAFAGGVSPFAVSGVPVDRDALVVEAGLAWQASPALSLGVNYSGQIRQRAQEHALKGNFTWQFESY